MIERHAIVGREEWLELRKRDVTGSHIAAVIDAHEYVTKLALWHHHRGSAPLSDEETPAMERGALLEGVALKLLSKRHPDWHVEAPGVYLRDPEVRIGGTPDCIVYSTVGQIGVVEVKVPDYLVYQRDWIDDEGRLSPPASAAIQAITYRHLLAADFAMVGVLRVGRRLELELVTIEEPPELWPRVLEAVAEFWRSVEAGTPPEPNFERDAELVLRLNRKADPGTTVDLSGNNRLPTMRMLDAQYAEAEKQAHDKRKQLKAELVALMGSAETALFNGEVIATAKTVNRPGYEVKATTYRAVHWKGKAA
jgi:predicted phage-related endonuclease